MKSAELLRLLRKAGGTQKDKPEVTLSWCIQTEVTSSFFPTMVLRRSVPAWKKRLKNRQDFNPVCLNNKEKTSRVIL
jgi:hypothetical protein